MRDYAPRTAERCRVEGRSSSRLWFSPFVTRLTGRARRRGCAGHAAARGKVGDAILVARRGRIRADHRDDDGYSVGSAQQIGSNPGKRLVSGRVLPGSRLDVSANDATIVYGLPCAHCCRWGSRTVSFVDRPLKHPLPRVPPDRPDSRARSQPRCWATPLPLVADTSTGPRGAQTRFRYRCAARYRPRAVRRRCQQSRFDTNRPPQQARNAQRAAPVQAAA